MLTNRKAEHAVERPVKFQKIFATLNKCAGLDVGRVRLFEEAGVPQNLIDDGIQPMCELV